MSVKSVFEISEMTGLGKQVYQIVEDGNPQGKYIIVNVDEWEQFENARSELAALRARCERAEAELNTIREKVDPLEGQTLIEAIDYLLLDDSSAEIYRSELATVTAERDAFAAESEAVHRAINEMCGTDTSTIGAVQHVINERDTARDALKMYDRQRALQQ